MSGKRLKVIATMRNPEKESELSALENVTMLPLKVTDLEQINSTVTNILNRFEVDVVLNNAGYGLIRPLEAFSDAAAKQDDSVTGDWQLMPSA